MNYFDKLIIRKEAIYMLNWLKVHGPHVAAVVFTILGFLIPSLQAAVSAHPGTSIATAAGIAIAAYNMTAPKDVARLK